MIDIKLVISIAIVAAGILGLVYWKRVNGQVDQMLMKTGGAATAIKFVIYAVCVVVFIVALYAIYMWAKTGMTPTLDQSYNTLSGDLSGSLGDAAYNPDTQSPSANAGENNGVDVFTASASKGNSNLQAQSSKMVAIQNGTVNGMMSINSIPDNILEKYYTPRFDTMAFSGCSRSIKPNGNCEGISRHFVDDQYINQCNKLRVVAPQQFPWAQGVKFVL